MVAHFDPELEQMNVKIVFLHSELEERIYIKQPEGYIQERQEAKVCFIKKSFYGLKQSPRQWYKRLDSFMIKVRYNRCEYDNCIYFKSNDDPTYLLLYVDDMLIVVRNKTHIQKLKAQLKREFNMKDLGESKKILGMEITQDKAQINFGYPRRTTFSKYWKDST